MAAITVLHTSDWHLGQQLRHKRRDEEFEAFLIWLVEIIGAYAVDALVVAGDVFDTATPSPAAQRMYYDFLAEAGKAGARHIVITAGNHDSPLLLTACAKVLKNFQVHVIGNAPKNVEEEILVLRDPQGKPELIVCAAPFLRDRDLRRSAAGETQAEKSLRLVNGITEHYALLANLARNLSYEAGGDVPVLAMGHLFTRGAEPGDHVRDLYVGNQGFVPSDIFPAEFDYVALGHIHKPQIVAGETRRYSGSPLPMSFGEAGQRKEVTLIKFNGRLPAVEAIPVPVFRQLVSIRGSRSEILNYLRNLVRETAPDAPVAWLEIQHDGTDSPGDLGREAYEITAKAPFEILCIKAAATGGGPAPLDLNQGLEDLSPEDIFIKRLETQKMPDEQKDFLLNAFRELMAEWQELQRGEEA